MKAMVYGEPDNWKQLRSVRWGDAVLSESSEARFLPCGTAIASAQKLERKWIGIDITHLSIALQKYRLEAMFPGTTFKVDTVGKLFWLLLLTHVRIRNQRESPSHD